MDTIDTGTAAASLRALALAAALALTLASAAAETYDIGAEMDTEAFWRSDPVLFVKRHEAQGFKFTSSLREGADTRRDGGVSFHGVPAFETKVLFGPAGVDRVELVLYAAAGTEAVREVRSDNAVLRGVERREVRMDRAGFSAMLARVRESLTAKGAKPPPMVAERVDRKLSPDAVQKSQTWPKSSVATVAKLVWNYSQQGARAETFEPGFARLTVDGPARAAASAAGAANSAPSAKGARKIAGNVVHGARGDVYVDGVPMVDQGQKGYCAAAVAERVLKYYGVDVDEHEIAQAAGTSALWGTTTEGMKNSVSAVGRRYKLATVVAYGDFEKPVNERIGGLVKEVSAYNKAAKKLKKPEIPESAYISRSGNTITYNPAAVDSLSDPEVRREMRVNGSQKSRYTKFMADVKQQVNRGIPLFWGVELGVYPEPECPQSRGGHMRLIIGYNDERKEILYSDTWGAGHELKRMPADWAWTVSRCLMYMKPLSGQ